jgi:hypothetical protein
VKAPTYHRADLPAVRNGARMARRASVDDQRNRAATTTGALRSSSQGLTVSLITNCCCAWSTSSGLPYTARISSDTSVAVQARRRCIRVTSSSGVRWRGREGKTRRAGRRAERASG